MISDWIEENGELPQHVQQRGWRASGSIPKGIAYVKKCGCRWLTDQKQIIMNGKDPTEHFVFKYKQSRSVAYMPFAVTSNIFIVLIISYIWKLKTS